ncbi:MAG: zinc metalloprotease [Phycisphaerae bacterium]|nr:MAG: zinc metalloprotease [Phycisphaerae bacterium]
MEHLLIGVLKLQRKNAIVERQHITVRGIPVEVIRKRIKNLHLVVYPPDGRVRVSAPAVLKAEAIRFAVVSKMNWIHKQQAKFKNQEHQTGLEFLTGESHYVAGRCYRLNVLEYDGVPLMRIRNETTLEMRVRPGTDWRKRQAVLHGWYRARLREQVPNLIRKWEPIIGVKVSDWRIKRMKTRWGTCNIQARRIWLNLELAKKPVECLEYVTVHELVHLLERLHNDRFRSFMDQFLPNWRLLRDTLNRSSQPRDNEEQLEFCC